MTSTFQAIPKLLTQKDIPAKSSEHLPNCNFANLLVCRINGFENFENILGNPCGKGLQGICDGVNHLYGVNESDGKRISKTFAEIAVC